MISRSVCAMHYVTFLLERLGIGRYEFCSDSSRCRRCLMNSGNSLYVGEPSARELL
jgi:hypothetical protein